MIIPKGLECDHAQNTTGFTGTFVYFVAVFGMSLKITPLCNCVWHDELSSYRVLLTHAWHYSGQENCMWPLLSLWWLRKEG